MSKPQLGEYCSIADDVQLGQNVVIGNRVTIFPGTNIGDGVRILDGAVIGRLTVRTQSVHRASPDTFLTTRIGPGSVIGCNTVLYTGITIGHDCLLADGVSLREGVVLESSVLLGRYVTVNYDAHIGARTKIMDFTHITGNAKIGSDCFVSIHVGTANDNDVYLRHLGLHAVASASEFQGPIVGNYVVIGAGAILNPGVEIGDGSLVASGALVTRSLPSWCVAMGTPARPVRMIPEDWRDKVLQVARERGQTLAD